MAKRKNDLTMRSPLPTCHLIVILTLLVTQQGESFLASFINKPQSRRFSLQLKAENGVHEISSPVLKQVYPAILTHIEEYGNPNIPLGTGEGRMCQTLRRLHTQQKLTESDITLLEDLGFLWHSLEDVYKTADFEELFQRLLQYGEDFSPPKKYPQDPELGAWVTGVRRVGEFNIDAKHRKRLNDIGFQWVSPRKCGSAFMKQYRDLCSQLETTSDPDEVLSDPKIQEWIQAQRMAVARGALSETRKHYLEEILGSDWLDVKTTS